MAVPLWWRILAEMCEGIRCISANSANVRGAAALVATDSGQGVKMEMFMDRQRIHLDIISSPMD